MRACLVLVLFRVVGVVDLIDMLLIQAKFGPEHVRQCIYRRGGHCSCPTARVSTTCVSASPLPVDAQQRVDIFRRVEMRRAGVREGVELMKEDALQRGEYREPGTSTEYIDSGPDGWGDDHARMGLSRGILNYVPSGVHGVVVEGGPFVGGYEYSDTSGDDDHPPSCGCYSQYACLHDSMARCAKVGRGLPRGEEKVELCSDPGCMVGKRYMHIADPDGEKWGGKCDRVVAGTMYRSSSCERTCHGCGATRSNRTNMFMCHGCYALDPYIREEQNRPLLFEHAAIVPVYCGLQCQAAHWWCEEDGHASKCPRYDQAIHALIADRVPCVSDHDGDVPFGVVQKDGSSMPRLVRSSLHLHGVHGGMGYT